jgi:hypothetical protein
VVWLAVRSSLLALLVLGIWHGSVSAASVELARKADGTRILGVKVEGDIVPGDAMKLLAIYEYYGYVDASPVYLRSKGGDVREAIKMGMLIRALRLETEVPLHHNGEILSLVPASNKDNSACASACFLVFAGGINRSGDFLVLHRPYLSKNAVANISDVDHEAAQKQAMNEVRDYLKEMEVDQFFIDKMMWTSSQDGYVTTLADVLNHHLNDIVPSIEEIVLPECNVTTQHERDTIDATSDPNLRQQLLAKFLAGSDCESKQLESLRSKAWEREHEDELQAKCGHLSPLSDQETQTMIAFFKKPADQRAQSGPEEKQAIIRLLEKKDALKDCRGSALLSLTINALHRGSDAPPGASPPPTATPNPLKLLSLIGEPRKVQ